MSIAYQSWEIGSGPTVGYKIQPNSESCGFCRSQLHHHHAVDSIPCGFTSLIYRHSSSADTKPPSSSAAGKLLPNSSYVMNSGGRVSPNNETLRHATATNINDNAAAAAAAATTAATAKEGALVERLQEHDTRPMASPSSSLVTSSISGDTSDESGEKEVQSKLNGPLDHMDTLMTTLPVRRGLSKFYVGKSRSFTSLADVKSIKDLAKPENSYTKRRKLPKRGDDGLDKHRFPPPRISTAAAGISKKPIVSNATTTLTLAVAMCSKGEGGGGGVESSEELDSSSPSKRWEKSCRSLSLTDLRKA